VPIAVFDRPGTAHRALAGTAAQRFAAARLPVSEARRLAHTKPPAWVFIPGKLDPHSATQIRAANNSPLPPMPETITAVTLEEPTIATSPEAGNPDAGNIAPLPSRPRKPRKGKGPPPAELLRQIVETLEDGKAEGIVTIDLAGKTTLADYMVIASGRSSRQVAALTDHLEQALPIRLSVEGRTQGDWVLIDAGDIIVHIFRPDIRAYYNLEKMWGAEAPSAEELYPEGLDTEAAAAIVQ
jgi:ribosome silencing factor RsfS/YbeB/iojap